jgi:hypothetical protein
MPKYKTLKEIHKYLIKNNLFHRDDDYLIKKKILLRQESKKETPSSLYEKPQILTDRGEIY